MGPTFWLKRPAGRGRWWDMGTAAETAVTAPVGQARRGHRRLPRVLAVTLGLVLVLTACNPYDNLAVAELVNQSRAQYGRAGLRMHGELTAKAQDWAEYLARIGYLKHSNLSDGVSAPWQMLGENVGYGPSIQSVHNAYLNSPGHRANILDTRYNYMGTGVAWSGSRVYTVQVFMRCSC
ncbi:MAG: CAP domain-containing protein [Actinobacteria bacterium]|nr:MAG: CAP domain-containing protein [Actinomycetota bacterium]RIK03707.1 MAG: hypothetical protein DCC48_15805 [Acidobacteriota bacterium]